MSTRCQAVSAKRRAEGPQDIHPSARTCCGPQSITLCNKLKAYGNKLRSTHRKRAGGQGHHLHHWLSNNCKLMCYCKKLKKKNIILDWPTKQTSITLPKQTWEALSCPFCLHRVLVTGLSRAGKRTHAETALKGTNGACHHHPGSPVPGEAKEMCPSWHPREPKHKVMTVPAQC